MFNVFKRGILKRFMCMILVLSFSVFVPQVQAEAAAPIAKGIDVSKYQGAINWPAVAASGVTFAFIKVGSAKSGVDPMFIQNMIGAQSVGIKTGVYIYSYALNVEQAAAEAQFVLACIANLPVNMPVVYDIEDSTQKGLSAAEVSMMSNTFCAIVEAEGYYPMVYANTYWYKSRLTGVLFDKWVAQWSDACEIPDAAFWQYSDKGTVNGIAGAVDLNYQFKDLSASIVNVGWVPRKGFMYYYNGYKMQRGWQDIGGARYYLGTDGRMNVGWLTLDNKMYFLQANGMMSIGFTPIGTSMYYFAADGSMLTGMQNVNGGTYLFQPDGVMYIGMFNNGSNMMYFHPDGHMATGLTAIASQNYYFDQLGAMQTGWVPIAGNTYLFAPDGPMVHGWFSDGAYKYYLAVEDGHRVSGMQIIDGKNYYFDANGRMLIGYQTINGATYLFDADGSMHTGWYQNGVINQYFGADGVMAVGATVIDGKTYTFDATGNMQVGLTTIGTATYFINADGSLYTGLFNDGVHVYYFNEDGTRLENATLEVNGVTFTFDAQGNATIAG